jgi:hypothetical protein
MGLPAHTRQQFDGSHDDDLENIVAAYGPNRPEGAYCLSLLERRRAKKQALTLDSIDSRLVSVESAAKKPESETWAFRLSVVAIIIGLAGVAIAVLSWRRPVLAPSVLAPVSSKP